jgi:GNAT superfamily N-acetyltransferase
MGDTIRRDGDSAATRIRLATEADRLPVFKLSVYMHQETDFAHYDFDPQKAINNIGAWIHGNDERFLIVAERGGEVAGMLFMSLKRPWFGGDVMASEDVFYVHPQHRGSRAAHGMLKMFCQVAKDRGAKHLRAGVATGSGPAAEKLYRHFGMHYVGGNFSAHLN